MNTLEYIEFSTLSKFLYNRPPTSAVVLLLPLFVSIVKAVLVKHERYHLLFASLTFVLLRRMRLFHQKFGFGEVCLCHFEMQSG